ncbi:hypothetical protein BDZ97DRAFT_1757465 [Flammula alnicola]|nr:hypothetical protein BDZ97DRAFT_1757465 [Flammula alnicola]
MARRRGRIVWYCYLANPRRTQDCRQLQELGPNSRGIYGAYICVGGVNVSTLLRASRSALLENCEYLGANALVDELWECRITGPKPVHNGTYKVFIRYTASATRSTVPDPTSQ